jgi:predicted AAA+ superfamily ATPase
MDVLTYYNDILANEVNLDFVRGLYDSIDWNQKMIAITGARGAGKTTLLLQRQKKQGKSDGNSLYISLDHPYFYSNSLFDLADQFYKIGGRVLYIDEVHKYANWSRELKIMYDVFPSMKIVFTASSSLEIYRGEADLSRRVITYRLSGMSFREFLNFKSKEQFQQLELAHILQNHRDLANEILQSMTPDLLPLFKEYLKTGYFPYSAQTGGDAYAVYINQVITTILDTDIAYVEGFTPSTALKLKKLLAVLAASVPFQPNVAELARKLGLSRDSIYHYLKYLEKGLLILSLHAEGKGISLLQKPEKLYLENTNFAYALARTPDIGNLRETFVLNQLINSGYEVHYPKVGDFKVQEYTFEVGGSKKGTKQIAGLEKAYVVADDTLIGFGNKIPIWLFGFLY